MSDSFQDVYAKHLLKRHGYPLWTPEPMSTLPEVYQQDGLQIGDVGTVDSDGQFDVLFNICKRSDNSLHMHGVPENFQPIEPGAVKCTWNALSAHPIFSHGIQQVLQPDKPRPSGDYEFTTSARTGAILLLPQGAMSAKLVSPERFRDAAMKSALDWCEFAKKRYGLQHRDLDRSLYLITGFYKARSWYLGSFNNSTGATGRILARQNDEYHPNVSPLTFEFSADSHGGGGASMECNQTIFITGFKITVNRQLLEVMDVQSEITWSILFMASNHGIRTLRSESIGDFQQWMRRDSINTEMPISDPDSSTSSSDIYHLLAYNALRKVRLGNWGSAYDDANKSITTLPSTMGYIAKALTQIGRGEPKEAMQVFDLALRSCDLRESNLLLLIKAVALFVAGKHYTAISRVQDLIALSRDDEAMYCCVQVLGKMYLMQGDYARAVQSLQAHTSSCISYNLETISLIFGWTFNGLQVTLQRYHFEDLYAAGRMGEATETLQKILDSFGGEIGANEVTPEWVLDSQKKCIEMLEMLGDQALSSGKHNDAITQYTSALSLNPSNPIDILMKRSKARASNGSWGDALTDANEVIKLEPSSHRGYARKYMALHGIGDYGAAYDALRHLISVSEDSSDEEIHRLRSNYNKAIAAIDSATDAIFKLCPLVLIDLAMGQLCDREGRRRKFRSEILFKKLVSEAAIAGVDRKDIRQIVVEYFKWVMLSHTWEGEEPTFKDVTEARSVHDLDRSPLDKKLRQFCETARKGDYRWAWSDTCCINKDSSTVLGQSLVSMYSWYEEAAETLVYLADVLSSSQIDALIKSRWMTRAWTLQELLAPKVIRFYDREWKLFLDDSDHPNHKESPVIKQALSQAMGLSPENITSFQPKHLGVREKLRLASTRNAREEEDNAYSLIGIFSSDIVPQYGLGKVALGQLLENIVARTGDVTVISWTGKSLPYNSALPDSLAVYSKIPFAPPPMDINEFNTCMDKLRTGRASQAPLHLYYKVKNLPRATFSDRCLRLPCAVFRVTKIGVQKLGGNRGNVYHAIVPLLPGGVQFRTTDLMPLQMPQKLVFIHPWLHDLHDPRDGFESDDEREAQSDVGSDDEWDSDSAESDVGSEDSTDYSSARSFGPLHAEPAAQMDDLTRALQLIVRLGRSFNALLLEQQSNNQYKRVAAENEIIISGVPRDTDPNAIEVTVLEIV